MGASPRAGPIGSGGFASRVATTGAADRLVPDLMRRGGLGRASGSAARVAIAVVRGAIVAGLGADRTTSGRTSSALAGVVTGGIGVRQIDARGASVGRCAASVVIDSGGATPAADRGSAVCWASTLPAACLSPGLTRVGGWLGVRISVCAGMFRATGCAARGLSGRAETITERVGSVVTTTCGDGVCSAVATAPGRFGSGRAGTVTLGVGFTVNTM